MFRQGTRNPWLIRSGYERSVDFCIWVLEIDGLQVAPFDQHADGDGSLRAAGMDATSWQDWLRAVIASGQQFHEELTRKAHEYHEKLRATRSDTTAAAPQAPLYPHPISPATIWPGEPRVQERLTELWDQFNRQGISNQRKEWEQRLHRKGHQIDRLTGENLWHRLTPYHKRIPGLVIHLVAYCVAVDMTIAPQYLILGINENAIDGSLQIARIERGAEALSRGVQPTDLPLQRPKVPAIAPNPRMAQARPLPEIIASLPEDDPKREVLEHSHWRHAYGNEPVILEFTHEKIRPHFRLYQFTLENAENERFQYTALQPTTQDSRDRGHEGLTGSITDECSPQFPAAPKDRPWINLQGGLNYYQVNGHRTYRFRAWGELHDNGFGVSHVVLSNAAGQRFEDTVEDNFVAFFAPQKVESPMQAEFYNQAGQLIGTQTVFDDEYHKLI